MTTADPPAPLGPLGRPQNVKHELNLGLEQLIVADLRRLLEIATERSSNMHLWIVWDDGSTHELGDANQIDRVGSIAQAEKVSMVHGYASYDDGSMIMIRIHSGVQSFTSNADSENSEAQRRVYRIRNEATSQGARLDRRYENKRKALQRYRVGVGMLGSALFTASAFVSLAQTYLSPWYWILVALGIGALVGTLVLRRRVSRIQIPALTPVIVSYTPAPAARDIHWWGSVASVVAAGLGFVAIVVAIVIG